MKQFRQRVRQSIWQRIQRVYGKKLSKTCGKEFGKVRDRDVSRESGLTIFRDPVIFTFPAGLDCPIP
jgi:hypothetical protein